MFRVIQIIIFSVSSGIVNTMNMIVLERWERLERCGPWG